MGLYEALKNAIEATDMAYRKHKDDSYFSIFYAHKKQRLEKVLSQEESCGHCVHSEGLLYELIQEQQSLTRLIEKEKERPTFDWYGEHYWEIVYDGELAGCEEAIAILENPELDPVCLETCKAL